MKVAPVRKIVTMMVETPVRKIATRRILRRVVAKKRMIWTRVVAKRDNTEGFTVVESGHNPQ